MAVPKRRTSKSKIKSRKRSHSRPIPDPQTCPECGAPVLSHRVCTACGMYKGRQVLTVSTDD